MTSKLLVISAILGVSAMAMANQDIRTERLVSARTSASKNFNLQCYYPCPDWEAEEAAKETLSLEQPILQKACLAKGFSGYVIRSTDVKMGKNFFLDGNAERTTVAECQTQEELQKLAEQAREQERLTKQIEEGQRQQAVVDLVNSKLRPIINESNGVCRILLPASDNKADLSPYANYLYNPGGLTGNTMGLFVQRISKCADMETYVSSGSSSSVSRLATAAIDENKETRARFFYAVTYIVTGNTAIDVVNAMASSQGAVSAESLATSRLNLLNALISKKAYPACQEAANELLGRIDSIQYGESATASEIASLVKTIRFNVAAKSLPSCQEYSKTAGLVRQDQSTWCLNGQCGQ